MARLKPVTPGAAPATKRRHPAPGSRLALGIFALLVTAAPLAFGSVDRITQIALLALFGMGLLAQAPTTAPLGRWGNRLALAVIAVLLVKEFAPATWFGAAAWRTELTQNFAMELPRTHHPEPSRALDGLLAAAVAVVWFLWVRTLAAEREHRQVIAWSLFAAAAIVAGVSFATRGMDPQAIYGLRYTLGWTGFGPFPNRNHTADFLAMGAMIGFGCVTWAGGRKKWLLLASGVVLLGLVLAAMLVTESRGGLLAFAVGTLLYLALAVIKVRSRKAFGLAAIAVILLGSVTAILGTKVLSRFQSKEGGQVSNETRVEVWKNTIEMWKDAPLFGHGLDSFTQIFPMYQHLDLEQSVVLHPESSWLQWLAELGLIPVALALAALAIFLRPHLREAFERRQSFFLHAGGFAAVGVLLCHSAIDVPAHRWGTAAFALAALALACPLRSDMATTRAGSRRVALVPFAVACFWALPFLAGEPAWSPLSLTRLVARETVGADVRSEELEEALRHFPLNAVLHQGLAARKARALGRTAPSAWQRHFAIAARLVPSSWTVLAEQARIVQRISPGLAIGYWQQAVERGNLHRDDIFVGAVNETAASPTAQASWGRYVESHPELLLTYAKLVPEAQARYYYSLWWQVRATGGTLRKVEIEDFYSFAPRWGTRSQFDEWMSRRAEWEPRDYRRWAMLLHQWGDEERAWALLSRRIPEPASPGGEVKTARSQLERVWRLTPGNFVNAQQLALLLHNAGETVQGDEIILAAAAQEVATVPPWFLHKAGYIYARNGRLGEAVAVVLRSK